MSLFVSGSGGQPGPDKGSEGTFEVTKDQYINNVKGIWNIQVEPSMVCNIYITDSIYAPLSSTVNSSQSYHCIVIVYVHRLPQCVAMRELTLAF